MSQIRPGIAYCRSLLIRPILRRFALTSRLGNACQRTGPHGAWQPGIAAAGCASWSVIGLWELLRFRPHRPCYLATFMAVCVASGNRRFVENGTAWMGSRLRMIDNSRPSGISAAQLTNRNSPSTINALRSSNTLRNMACTSFAGTPMTRSAALNPLLAKRFKR